MTHLCCALRIALCASQNGALNPKFKGPKMPPRSHVICTLPGCSNPHYATGLCRPHYIQRRNAIARAATQPINGAIRTTSKPAPIAIHGSTTLPPPALPTWIAPVPVLVPPPPAPVAVPAAPMLPVIPPAPVAVPAAPAWTEQSYVAMCAADRAKMQAKMEMPVPVPPVVKPQ